MGCELQLTGCLFGNAVPFDVDLGNGQLVKEHYRASQIFLEIEKTRQLFTEALRLGNSKGTHIVLHDGAWWKLLFIWASDQVGLNKNVVALHREHVDDDPASEDW